MRRLKGFIVYSEEMDSISLCWRGMAGTVEKQTARCASWSRILARHTFYDSDKGLDTGTTSGGRGGEAGATESGAGPDLPGVRQL